MNIEWFGFCFKIIYIRKEEKERKTWHRVWIQQTKTTRDLPWTVLQVYILLEEKDHATGASLLHFRTCKEGEIFDQIY